MKRRDFLEKVSELAKESAAAVALNRMQIGAMGVVLAARCKKWSPVISENSKTGYIEPKSDD
jgi:hypothetical protein